MFNDETFKQHLNKLEEIIRESHEELEGNCFYEHTTLNILPTLKSKQENLINISRNKKTIAEIGFNAGHSALLFLYDNPELESITFFDLCSHRYTIPCYEYLKSQFPTVAFTMVKGNTLQTLPSYVENEKKYDLIHMDGGHFGKVVESDAKCCKKLSDIVIVDDTDHKHINDVVDVAISEGWEEVDILPTKIYKHRIIKNISLG